ncbi:type VI secretion protein, partial [Klebsiella pneumoniae]|nr:hypothetical protein [Pseudomonas aeruginosa]
KRALSCYYSGNFSTGQQPETAFSGTSYIQRIGYPPGSSRYAVPGTREDKSSVAVPLKTAPASDSSRHHVIWPGVVVRGVPAKLRQEKIFIAPFSAPSVRRSFSLSPREEEE